MSSTVRILIPIFPLDSKEIFFKGYVITSTDNNVTIYITKYANSDIVWSEKQRENEIYGFCGAYLPTKVSNQFSNFLDIEQNTTQKINKLQLNRKQVTTTANCILMLYDYNSIKDSQAITDSKNSYFTKLVNLIQEQNGDSVDKDDSNTRNQQWLASSMFLQHVCNYWRLINWLINTLRRDKKVAVKQGNLILAIAVDIILGYIALQWLSQDKRDISIGLMGVLEKLINSLYSLLKWLMGAPVGLKLNNAFNKMLGKYFSYHVQLWWLFLDVSGEKLYIILDIYHYIGYLGFTFQTAIVSDLICIATFHSYCIYVYAARLFNIQISGLIALLRLFVGRKYNPLRGGIDSCEYTNQELFVGTVAFTMLLLLLPTTTLYYIVFTMFRVLSLFVQHLLAKIIYLIQTSPMYVVSLWVTNSPKVIGKILIEVINQEENAALVLRIQLLKKSIPELLKIFKPPVDILNKVEWGNLFSNVLVGKQIV
ncbi:hypothetical protein HW555_000777 [Spodoptera exigua]|uniref:Phosphatidylinositol N-acetylglucosaminyltransferase subunit Q n=1 Tax=Spodoptera exigua TaxID=7107 RepID=A0A835L9H0_SPOEX|nr:hypothetical protein HW555_000777 [Spodoptera exigua]